MEAATAAPGTGTEDELARKRAEQNGGEPAGDFPGEGDQERGGDTAADADLEPAIPPLTMEGEGQLSLDVGGEKPNISQVKMRGASIELPDGQFKKGQRVSLAIEGRVAKIEFEDKIDPQTGDVVSTVRRHHIRVEGVEQV